MKQMINKKTEAQVTNIFTRRKIFFYTIIASIIPALDILQRVFFGDFAFWYDPARDMLSALENLQKPTLIGPTSGVPGVFYGPYWIWMLSIGQLFSRDPRVADFIVSTIPYLFIFPFILSRYKNVFRSTTIAILWLLFLLSYNNYFTDMWNPHPAPLLMLVTIYLIFNAQFIFDKKNTALLALAGFTAGLLVNFHLSLGIGMMFGLLLYFGFNIIKITLAAKHKFHALLVSLIPFIMFLLGFAVAFGPYILFEIRHQFQQTQAFLSALLSFGAVVALPGLSQADIFNNFIERGADLVKLPVLFFTVFFVALIIVYGIHLRRIGKKVLDMKLLSIILSIFGGIAFIYFTAKNPIWEYHFLGIEVLFLLLIGVLIDKEKWVKILISVWIFILLMMNVGSFIDGLSDDPQKKSGTLAAKQNIVQGIILDAGNSDYTVYALNPAIYMYDYSYLFKQLANKDISYDPGLAQQEADFVYLIIPPDSKNVQDFISYRASESKYKKVSEQKYPDGTLIIKNYRMQ